MTKKQLVEIKNQLLAQAQADEWCKLAETIIALECAIRKEKKSNILKILNLKLDIYEAEKNQRVFENFNMDFFLNREYDYLAENIFSDEEF